jgi:hypothetical protein
MQCIVPRPKPDSTNLGKTFHSSINTKFVMEETRFTAREATLASHPIACPENDMHSWDVTFHRNITQPYRDPALVTGTKQMRVYFLRRTKIHHGPEKHLPETVFMTKIANVSPFSCATLSRIVHAKDLVISRNRVCTPSRFEGFKALQAALKKYPHVWTGLETVNQYCNSVPSRFLRVSLITSDCFINCSNVGLTSRFNGSHSPND